MGAQNSKQGKKQLDYAFYRPLRNRVLVLTILPLVLVFCILGIFMHYIPTTKPIIFLILALGFLVIGLTFTYLVTNLMKSLEKKTLNISLMDQQLLKMSRMAASAKLTHDFMVQMKDMLINIDSSADLAASSLNHSNIINLKDVLNQIKTESSKAIRSTDKLLSLTRPPGNQWVIQDIDLNQLIKHIQELLDSEFKIRGIRIQESLEDLIPKLRSNFSRLSLVIQNLFLVAVLDIKQGGDLFIKTSSEAAGVCIEIGYPSRHFDEHVLHRLADPAYALKSQDPGPWLALCAYYVERLTGEIRAENSAWGLKFTVTLPYRIDRPPSPAPRFFLKGI